MTVRDDLQTGYKRLERHVDAFERLVCAPAARGEAHVAVGANRHDVGLMQPHDRIAALGEDLRVLVAALARGHRAAARAVAIVADSRRHFRRVVSIAVLRTHHVFGCTIGRDI